MSVVILSRIGCVDQDLMQTPFPIGETVRLAVCPSFVKYCEQHVAIRDRIPLNIASLIAGRSGIVISGPILSSTNGLEFRTVSILTKEGVVERQLVPLKLIRRERQSPTLTTASAESRRDDVITDSSDEENEVDEHAAARSHILAALKQSTCRTGKHAVTGKVDPKKSELILTALKKELNSKKTPSSSLCQQKTGDKCTVGPQPPVDNATISGSTARSESMDTAAHKVIGDSDGHLAPIGTCFVVGDRDDGAGKNSFGDQPNDKNFSVESTLITSYPEKEQYLNDAIQMDATVDQFSATVQQMVTASDQHSKAMKLKQKKSQAKSATINIQKQNHIRKHNNSCNNHHGENSLEEASNSELIFMKSIAESDKEDSVLFEYSESINTLSTSTPSKAQRKNVVKSHTAILRPPPHPRSNLQAPPPLHRCSPNAPNIEIKISHFHPQDKVYNRETEMKEAGAECPFQKEAGEWEALISRAHDEELYTNKETIRPETTYLERFLHESLAVEDCITTSPKQKIPNCRDELTRQQPQQQQTPTPPPSSVPPPSSSSSSRRCDSQQQQRPSGLTVSNIRISKKHRPARPCRPPSSSRGPLNRREIGHRDDTDDAAKCKAKTEEEVAALLIITRSPQTDYL